MLGFLLAVLTGVTLGLLGGGGSILTVPILVYAVGIETKIAVALSLAVVGTTTLFGTFGHLRNKNVDIKVALIFGVFAIPSTFLGAYLSQFVSSSIQLIIFAIIMMLAAIFMFKGKKNLNKKEPQKNNELIILSGFFVGLLTGFIGVGGGFLIVPALILFTGTDMKKAVGTSLFIITINSFFGFISNLNYVEIPWIFLIQFTGCSVVGIFIGVRLVKYISQELLKKSFAIFLILMGLFILFKNISAG